MIRGKKVMRPIRKLKIQDKADMKTRLKTSLMRMRN